MTARLAAAARKDQVLLAAIHCRAVYGEPRFLAPATGESSRPGLRASTVGWDGPPGDRPARVVRIDPGDGATGVFLDDPVVVTLSHPADTSSATADTVRITDDTGEVPGRMRFSPDARVLVWTPQRPLHGGIRHTVAIAGLRDLRGREVARHESRFLPCPFAAGDVMN